MAWPKVDASEVDIVVSTARSNLDFLNSWREFLQAYHLIIVQHGPDEAPVQVPEGYDYDLFQRKDIVKVLGQNAKCISPNHTASRSFGWLLSKKKYIVTLEDDCFAAVDRTGELVDPVQQHLVNLTCPSTPFYFNTLYDPYRKGADFVRGYPFGLRNGVPTAVSHGLWVNVANYDAALKEGKEFVKRKPYVDAVLTVPKGSLMPVCGVNLAFDRELAGPAMYFGGFPKEHFMAKYNDTWAGLCIKAVCDHLDMGVKSGLPYVWQQKQGDGPEAEHANADKLFEKIYEFFQGVRFSEGATTAELCMLELAEMVQAKLGQVDGYFGEVAKGMASWIDAWRAQNRTAETQA
ncbi:hypothetical protein BSKO_10921 [Bryopsis sp. KO-2023]|nr:hypothetical protein BSKO_10921 [Bryopsis sp. KO-2023]